MRCTVHICNHANMNTTWTNLNFLSKFGKKSLFQFLLYNKTQVYEWWWKHSAQMNAFVALTRWYFKLSIAYWIASSVSFELFYKCWLSLTSWACMWLVVLAGLVVFILFFHLCTVKEDISLTSVPHSWCNLFCQRCITYLL